MECKYKIHSTNNVSDAMSYSDLLKKIKNSYSDELNSVDDIVFSKDFSNERQKIQWDRVSSLKENYTPIKHVDDADVNIILNGEPSIDGDISVLQFIDSDQFVSQDGDRYITPMNKDDYRRVVIERRMDMGETYDEAAKNVNNVLKNWATIQSDAFDIHKMAGNGSLYNSEVSIESIVDKEYDKVSNTLKDKAVLQGMFSSLRSQYLKNVTGKKVFNNVNFKSTINGHDIYGHIDYLTIDSNGTVEIYLYKISTVSRRYWPEVKLDKYKYQMVFLKQMLSDNGVNVKNMRMNIIPIYLNYDQDYKRVTKTKTDNNVELSTRGNYQYALQNQENVVKRFISGKANSFTLDNNDILSQAQQDCNKIFPDLSMRMDAIIGSVAGYIQDALDGSSSDIQIKKIDQPDCMYEVTVGSGEKKVTHKITDKTRPIRNQQIIDIVKKYIDQSDDEKGYAAEKLRSDIQSIYHNGKRNISTTNQNFIATVLSKYMYFHMEGDQKVYDWELLNDLSGCNILIFHNTKTDVYDFVMLSAIDFNTRIGNNIKNNILSQLGYYNSEYTALEGNYGNIELVRLMTFINHFGSKISSQKDGKVNFGEMIVLSPKNYGQHLTQNIGVFKKRYFNDIVDKVNAKMSPDQRIKDELENTEVFDFIDPIEHLLLTYKTAIETYSSNLVIQNLGFDELKDVDVEKANAEYLLEILQDIQKQLIDKDPSAQDPQKYNPNSIIHKLYYETSKAINYITGRIPQYRVHVSNIETTFLTATAQSDPNIGIIVEHLQTVNNSINEDFLDYAEKNIQHQFDTFKKAKGYTNLENITIGNQVKIYKNLYEIDPHTGEMTMNFKNPYDMTNDLTADERTILKHFLYQTANIITEGKFKQKGYKETDDVKIKEYIKDHPEYLWVPLERASRATARKSVKSIIHRIQNNAKRYFKGATSFDEFVNQITQEERAYMEERENGDSSIYHLRLHNPFGVSVGIGRSKIDRQKIAQKRAAMIKKYGPDYFEINLENLLIDFYSRQITAIKYNQFLIASKAFILELSLMAGNNQALESEKQYWEKYIKQNIFQRLPMSKEEQAIIGAVTPIKQAVSHLLVGGNIISFFRDLFEGAQQNFLRSMIKFNTQLDPKYIAKAYSYVTTHQNGSAMAVNLLSKLCLRYRLTNMDVSKVAERAKTNRNGIMNFENALYATLKTPDFINRMTLFVAQCMQDGCWDAFSLTEDGELKYDWRKDKRFEAYANNDMSDIKKYNEAKGLYYSLIRAYNNEHPDQRLELSGDLPTPYTNAQMASLRAQADNVYGSYDKSTRASYEGCSLGIMFGMFTTWMNGIVNNYLAQAHTGVLSTTQRVQEKDEYGKLLYMKDDGTLTTDPNEGVPLYKDTPYIVQGIVPTVITLIDLFRNSENKMQDIKTYLAANPHERANIKKFISDLIFMLLFYSIFKFAVTPAYADYKKRMKDMPALQNMLTEVLYKSSSRSWDQYKGLLNIVDYIGNDMTPPYYSTPAKVINDGAKVVFGDKQWQTMLTGNIAPLKAVKDTYRYGIAPNQ